MPRRVDARPRTCCGIVFVIGLIAMITPIAILIICWLLGGI